MVNSFVSSMPKLKLDTKMGTVSTDCCSSVDNVCYGQEGQSFDFFYVYDCFFTNLHLSFTFDEFIMGSFGCLMLLPRSFIRTHGLVASLSPCV